MEKAHLSLFVPARDSPTSQVIRRQLYFYGIAGQDADEVFSHSARNMRQDIVAAFNIHSKHRIGQRLDDNTIDLDRIFLGLALLALLR